MRQELINAILSGDILKFYRSKEWIKKRKDIIKRDNNECIICKRAGRYSQAQAVHHIKHLREHPALALADDNLISICNPCHNKEHPEKIHPTASQGYTNTERW